MRFGIIIAALFALLCQTRADEFYLTDSNGKQHGPFEFKQGETISIAGQKYTISKVVTKEAQIIQKMKNIVIPDIEFRRANVNDVFSFLQEQSTMFDTEPERKGVSSILKLGPSRAEPVSHPTDPFAALSDTAPQEESSNVPLITFSAHYVSLFDAMNIVCEICDLTWSVRNSVIMIEPKQTQETNRSNKTSEGIGEKLAEPSK